MDPVTKLINVSLFEQLVFKTKGESHLGVEGARSAQMLAQTAKNAESYAKMMVTEARLQQGNNSTWSFSAYFGLPSIFYSSNPTQACWK